jgi:hypothetical protein
VSTADSLFPTVICALKFFSHNIIVCLLQRIKRGLRGEEGRRCRCYERQRAKA